MARGRLLVLGMGYSASAAVRHVGDRFDQVWGTTRSSHKAAAISGAGATPLVFDGTSVSDELVSALEAATYILVSIAPADGGDPVLELLGETIARSRNLCHLLYLSTVGVYGDHDGAWVDEDTPPDPVSRRSIDRVEAERGWLALAAETGKPLALFRLSGIYGPGRNALVNIANGNSRRLVKPGQVFNRIHVGDIAKATGIAMDTGAQGIFNITDDEPAPPQDVVLFAHQLAGVAPPPEQDFETAELSSMARSFYGENKRVSNRKSKEVLGMQYDWPDYRAALGRMWREDSWR